MRPRDVKVYLPKFKMTSKFELSALLKKLGMPTAFTPGKADFSGMATSEKLFISAVIHKAFVEVNEKGNGSGRGNRRRDPCHLGPATAGDVPGRSPVPVPDP